MMPSKAKQTTTAEKSNPTKSAASKKGSPAAGTSAKDASAGKGASGKKVNPALMKPLQPSKELAAVVGSDPLPRAEVVSKVWDYVARCAWRRPIRCTVRQRIRSAGFLGGGAAQA